MGKSKWEVPQSPTAWYNIFIYDYIGWSTGCPSSSQQNRIGQNRTELYSTQQQTKTEHIKTLYIFI
jgi:hypothetical protein